MADNENRKDSTKRITRRDILKGFGAVPFLGALAYDFWKSKILGKVNDKDFQIDLGINDRPSVRPEAAVKNSGQLVKIGIAGIGGRGPDLFKALGFVPKDWYKEQLKLAEKKDQAAIRRLQTFRNQEILNVQVNGICDVFDLHAEKGLDIARNGIQPNGEQANNNNVKRYRTYNEMAASPEIDAVIIATPDFHHATMTIDAVNEGKHVYCEKAMTLTEAELNKVYKVVKNSNIVFQLGHQNSKNETFKQAKEIIEKGILGKVTLIETTTNRNSKDGAWIRHLNPDGTLKPGSSETIDWEQWLGNTEKIPFSLERFYGWARWFAYDTGLGGQLFSHEIDSVNQIMGFAIPKTVASSGGIYFHKEPRDMPDVFHSVLEFPDKEFSLLYSASLANSRFRGRVFMGNDASMEVGNNLKVIANSDSPQFSTQINNGIINPLKPIYTYPKKIVEVDGITSATEKYYAQRGLIDTAIDGKNIDVTYLHMKDWIDVIRNGGTTGCNIEKAFANTVSVLMLHRSYVEKRKVAWDSSNRKII
jgi:predicted dehydrogenase